MRLFEVRTAQAIVYLMLCSAAGLLFLSWLVSGERYFLGPDPKVYFGAAKDLFFASEVSLSAVIDLLKLKSASTHNSFFALPLLSVFEWIGFGQHEYLYSVFWVYFVSSVLALTLLFSRVLTSTVNTERMLIVSFFVFMTLPTAWVVLSIYKPDLGGILFLSGILIVLIGGEERVSFRALLWLSFLVFCALLFRRHLAYSIVSIYLAVSLAAFAKCIVRKGGILILSRFYFYLALSGGMAFGLLFIVAPGYALQFLENNYAVAYSGYSKDWSSILYRWLEFYGALPVLLAFLGFFLGLRSALVNSYSVIVLALAAVVWSVLWLVTSRFYDYHFSINPILLFVAIGDALLFYWVLVCGGRPMIRIIGASVLTFTFTYPLAHNFFPKSLVFDNWVLGYRVIPLERHKADWDSYKSLIHYLENNTRGVEKIYVAASSSELNNSVLLSASEALSSRPLNILKGIAQVDKRDYYKAAEFLSTDYVVVASPFQFHLPSGEQRVVGEAALALSSGTALSSFYMKMDRSFDFYSGSGFQVEIYRRLKEVPLQVRSDYLDDLAEAMNITDFYGRVFFELSPSNNSSIGMSNKGLWTYTGNNRAWPAVYSIVGKAEGRVSLNSELRISPHCKLLSIHFSDSLTAQPFKSVSYEAVDFGVLKSISIDFVSNKRFYMSLVPSEESERRCGVFFKGLSVSDELEVF